MQRIHSVEPKTAQGRTKELLETVQQAFGVIPNTAKVMANSPAVLDSFLAFSTAMGGAKIGTKLYNQVKLSTSETNACDYCTSILSAVAPSAGRRHSCRSHPQLRRTSHQDGSGIRQQRAGKPGQGQRSTACRCP